MTAVAAYSFLVFNLLCAPCFAAMGAIKREMNNIRWFWIAIGYQCGFAYLVSLCIYQFGTFFAGGGFGIGTAAAVVILCLLYTSNSCLYYIGYPIEKISKIHRK